MAYYIGNDRCCDKLNNMSSLFPPTVHWNYLKIHEPTDTCEWVGYCGDSGSLADFGATGLEIDPVSHSYLYINTQGQALGPAVTPGTTYRFTQKIDVTGSLPSLAWAKTAVYPFTANGQFTNCIRALSNGDLFTTPSGNGGALHHRGRYTDKTTGADGTTFNFPVDTLCTDIDYDSSGNIYVTQGGQYLQKCSPTGTHIWRKQSAFSQPNAYQTVAVSSTRVAGCGFSNTGFTFAVSVWNLAGTFQWGSNAHYAAAIRDSVWLSNGSLVIVGDQDVQTSGFISVARCLSSSGTLLWSLTRPTSPSTGYISRANCVVVDSSDNVYIGLSVFYPVTTNSILKFDSSGTLLWSFDASLGHLLNKPDNSAFTVRGLAIDEANGFVYAACGSRQTL